MSESNDHIFTATDIDKYHKGELSGKEMHAMEKAALEDPFLADALEGYAATKGNVAADIRLLKKELAERVKGAKVIALPSGRKKSYTWLRVAVMLIAVAGAGLVVYQLAFNNKKPELADSQVKKPGNAVAADSASSSYIMPQSRDLNRATTTPLKNDSPKRKIVTDTLRNGLVANEPPATLPANGNMQSESVAKNNEGLKERAITNQEAVMKSKREDEAVVFDKNAANPAPAQNQQTDNLFRGRVTDPKNNPVPFANITNTRDNAGTYTDAKGNFNFISPDSVLDVEVRSVGYENNNSQLRANVSSNQVILQDDRKSLSEAIIVNKKPNLSARSRMANVQVEEPEPADGWSNYDNYLLNNLAIPQEIRSNKMKGEVELSLEVDKRGDPVNIKVEKSLCNECDQEAVRLVKQGPKWKRKARKTRTSVRIPFNANHP